MTDSKPVSQTKTAAQWVTEIDECGPDGPVTRTVLHILVDTKIPDLAVVLEAYAESELAALREQQADAFKMQNREIAALKHELAASERIAEGLHEALKKYGKHLSWTEVTPFQCRYDPEALKYYPDDERYRCNCGLIESESVLARYQAQKGKP